MKVTFVSASKAKNRKLLNLIIRRVKGEKKPH